MPRMQACSLLHASSPLLPPWPRYVVHCHWSPSGKYFVTGSYDKSICIFKVTDDSHSDFEMGVGMEVEMIKQLAFKGAIEGFAMRKVMDSKNG